MEYPSNPNAPNISAISSSPLNVKPFVCSCKSRYKQSIRMHAGIKNTKSCFGGANILTSSAHDSRRIDPDNLSLETERMIMAKRMHP